MAKLNLCISLLTAIAIFEFYPLRAMCFPLLNEKTVKMDRFMGRCPGPAYEHLPVYFRNVHFNRARRIYYISGSVVFEKNVSEKLKLKLELERCTSKEALDSCEPYPDVNIRNLCELAGASFQPWTPFIRTLKPPFHCPAKAGTYTTTNGTFDGSALLVLPVEGWYWKVHAKVFETVSRVDTLIMCVYVEGQVANI